MLPIAVDVRTARVVVVAQGRPGQQRYELVHAAGCERIALFAPDHGGWACETQAHLRECLPDPADFEGARIVFIAGFPLEVAQPLAEAARRAGALVNVEDVNTLCDFHVPAIVRRGDLLISVSTGGKAPGVAQRLRAYLGEMFGPEWESRIARLGEARLRWRSEGASKDEVIHRSRAMISDEGWLPDKGQP